MKTVAEIDVKKDITPIIWFDAPVSMIHGFWSRLWWDATWKEWEWIKQKIEYDRSK